MKRGKRSAAARAAARAEQAGKPRFAAPVPLRGEATATPRLKMNRSHFIIRMEWLPTPDESLARREKRRE